MRVGSTIGFDVSFVTISDPCASAETTLAVLQDRLGRQLTIHSAM
jgi:hypothetical protein